MKYLVEIDEKHEHGKSALKRLKSSAKKGKGITIKRNVLADIDEDARMIKKMLRARKECFVDTERFLSKLKSSL